MLISVDPGVKVAGVAAFDDGELAWACLVQGEHPFRTAAAAWDAIGARVPRSIGLRLVVEKMQVYKGLKVDNNDLIEVALMAGAIGMLAFQVSQHVETVRPAAWKGQVPKTIMVNRIRERLSADETARVELPKARSLHHNVWDAIGLGLFSIDRLKEDARSRGRKL